MALYVSKARRARRTTIVCLVVAIVAGGLGWAVGHGQVPSVDERVQSVKSDAENIATDLARLDIEYRQVVGATGGGQSNTDNLETSVVAPLRDEQRALQETMDRAPWLAAAHRAAMLDAIVAAEQAAKDRAPAAEFRQRLDAAAKAIRANLAT